MSLEIVVNYCCCHVIPFFVWKGLLTLPAGLVVWHLFYVPPPKQQLFVMLTARHASLSPPLFSLSASWSSATRSQRSPNWWSWRRAATWSQTRAGNRSETEAWPASGPGWTLQRSFRTLRVRNVNSSFFFKVGSCSHVREPNDTKVKREQIIFE